jgi:hypothetical protein
MRYYEAWSNKPLDTEIMQTYIVTDWLAGKLNEIGEPVAIDFHGVCWWGRTCYGQSIEDDGTIQEIWDLINEDKGG